MKVDFYRSNIRIIAGLFFLVIFAVVIRIPFFDVPMVNDEGASAYTAKFWPEYQELYKDINYDRFQGLFLIFKAILLFIGSRLEDIRLGAAIYNAGTVVAVFFVARAIHSEKAGWLSGFLFALLSAAPGIEGFSANAELFAVLPLTVSAYFVWEKRWRSAGLMAGLSIMFKPIGLSGLILMLMYMVFSREKIRSYVEGLLFFSVFPVLSVLHGAWIGIDYYIATFWQKRLAKFSVFSFTLKRQFTGIYASMMYTYSVWLFSALSSLFSFIDMNKKKKVFVLFWLFSGLIGMSMGGEWYYHYYFQIIPVLSVLGAIGFFQFSKSSLFMKKLWLFSVISSILIFAVFQGRYWFMKPEEVSLSIYNRPFFNENKSWAEYIKEVTADRDKIYVAFSQAEVYYLSERLSAVPRQFWWRQIETDDESWSEVLRVIRSQIPAAVLLVQPPPHKRLSHADFINILQKSGYDLEKKTDNAALYVRSGSNRNKLTL